MKRYEYKAINLLAQTMVAKGTPIETLSFQIINKEGADGWRCLNPESGTSLYFERESEDA